MRKDKKEIREDTKGKEEEMKRKNCPRFNRCSAPLCPLCTEKELKNYLWYPGEEEICPRKDMAHLLWTKNQKKIEKKAKDSFTYFTYEMLNRKITIKKGIMGINPDKDEEAQLKKWLKAHPAKKELTEEEKEIYRKRFEKNVLQREKKLCSFP